MSIVKNVDIQLIDDDAKSTTVKLDNPKDNITKNEIVQVFTTAINNNWLLSNYGSAIKGVGQVQLTTSEKVLLEGEAVYVTPASANITLSNSPVTTTFTVSNGSIQMVELTGDNNFMAFSETHTSTTISVTTTPEGVPMGTVVNNLTLKILVGTTIINIPIVVTIE